MSVELLDPDDAIIRPPAKATSTLSKKPSSSVSFEQHVVDRTDSSAPSTTRPNSLRHLHDDTSNDSTSHDATSHDVTSCDEGAPPTLATTAAAETMQHMDCQTEHDPEILAMCESYSETHDVNDDDSTAGFSDAQMYVSGDAAHVATLPDSSVDDAEDDDDDSTDDYDEAMEEVSNCDGDDVTTTATTTADSDDSKTCGAVMSQSDVSENSAAHGSTSSDSCDTTAE